jgi:hypothetical protein
MGQILFRETLFLKRLKLFQIRRRSVLFGVYKVIEPAMAAQDRGESGVRA